MYKSYREVFVKVRDHLKSMKKPSRRSSDDACLYRGPNGSMCAIGCLIPDDIYEHKFEYNSASDIFGWIEGLFSARLRKSDNFVVFLEDLQLVHDNPMYWEEDGFSKEGVAHLERIRKEYGIKL